MSLLIEIKSSSCVRREDVASLQNIARDLGDCEAVCFSCDSRKKKIGDIMVYPWAQGIKRYFST